MPLILNGDGSVGPLSATEVGYLDGVTSAVQPQINAKVSSKILQVVGASYSVSAGSSSTTWVDTGLTATITPFYSSSKILVVVNQNGIYKNNNTNSTASIQLLRGASVIANLGAQFGYNSAGTALPPNMFLGSTGISLLDSPATTSATTYKTQIQSVNNNTSVFVQSNGETSTMILWEIAA